MVRKNLLVIVMFIFVLNISFLSAEKFGYNLIEESDFNNNTAFVNSSRWWNTISLGPMDDVNSTQHESIGGTLNIKESWLRIFGLLNWLAIDGSNSPTDNINWGNQNLTNVDTIKADFLGSEEGRILVAHLKEITGVDHLQFNITFQDGCDEGRVTWNIEDGTLQYGLPGGSVCLQIGQENVAKVKNDEGEIIYNCQALFSSGAEGNNLLVQTPIASNVLEAPLTFGLATEELSINGIGYAATFGIVRDCDTSAWEAGDVLYLSATEEGNLTNVRPVQPNTGVIIGIVKFKSGENGSIALNPTTIQRLALLSDVYAVGLEDGSILRYNGTSARFEISTSYTRDEIDNLIASVEHNASVISTLTGNLDSGVLSDVLVRDNLFYNVSEVTGAPGFEIHLNYTGVANFNDIVARLEYRGSSIHIVTIALQRCSDGGWDDEFSFSDTDGVVDIIEEVLDASNHICGLDQNVSLRIIHTSSGNPSHDIFIDGVHLVRGATSASPTEVDPNAIHKSGDTIWEGNDNHGGFNITNVLYGFFTNLGSVSTRIINIFGVNANFSGNVSITGNIDNPVNITLSNGGKLWGNSTCTFLSSPDGSTVQEICNA